MTSTHVAEGFTVGYAADGRYRGADTLTRFGDPDVFRKMVLEDIAFARSTVTA